MSLRARLGLVLAAVLLGPLLAALVGVGFVVPRAAGAAGQQAAVRDGGSVAVALAARCRAIGDVASRLAADVATGAGPTRAISDAASAAAVEAATAGRPELSVAVLDPGGTSHASAGVADAVAGSEAAAAGRSSCAAGRAGDPGGPAVLAESVPASVGDLRVATVVVWQPLDDASLRLLRSELGVRADVALVDARGLGVPSRFASGSPLVAASAGRDGLEPVLRAAADGSVTGTVSGRRYALRDPGAGLPYAVLSVSPPGDALLLRVLVGLVLGAVAVAAVLARVLARRLTAPLADLTSTADRLGAGDLAARSSVSGRDEVGRLAGALDSMAARLQASVGELEAQRDALSDTFNRFGEALGRTHDLDGLLSTLVEAALRGADGVAGVALLAEPGTGNDGGLRGTGRTRRARPGARRGDPLVEGGRLVERGRAVDEAVPGARSTADALYPLAARAADENAVVAAPSTAGTGPALALPLVADGRVLGALAIARAPGGRPFGADAGARVKALAEHAGTAIANVRLHEETRRMSVTDPLTGAGNLRQLSTTLSREVERATRFDRPLTVLMLDLDHFKDVNDDLGHAFGDVVLREFAHRLADCLREVDTVARYGGEEFAVILPETDSDGGARVAERVLDAVRTEPFRSGDVTREVTVSAGVASFPAHGRSAAEVLRSADTALYAAKRSGRDRWHVAGVAAGAVGTPAAG